MDGSILHMTALPSAVDLDALLSTARRIVNDARHLLLQGYGRVTAARKSDGSLVTETDHAADQFITTQLVAAYPDHAILSEERNTQYDPSADFTWVIDPLDGTTNFARGIPIWGVSVALLFKGLPLLGLLDFPLLHEVYEASYQRGAILNGRALATAADSYTTDQHFLMLCTRTPRRYTIDTPLKPRILGSAAYHIASVANGSALAGIEATPKLWDLAAALLILKEAGGGYQRLDNQQAVFPLAPVVASYEKRSFPLLTAANDKILDEVRKGVASRPS
ncbi:MAG: inositol monophosphatase [Caldilineaceae bacterium]|nr:inositol monophosphatase [Caldilineaceae bacterium]